MLQYYFHYHSTADDNEYFLYTRSLFQETAEKAIVLKYDVINDLMMMQCIISKYNILFQLKIASIRTTQYNE